MRKIHRWIAVKIHNYSFPQSFELSTNLPPSRCEILDKLFTSLCLHFLSCTIGIMMDKCNDLSVIVKIKKDTSNKKFIIKCKPLVKLSFATITTFVFYRKANRH